MSDLWLILAMGAGVFTLRFGGLSVSTIAVPPAWERAFGFVPVALLTALVVIGLTGGGETEWERLGAAGVAALVAWRTRTMWACIASGLAVYWVLRVV